ncbi:MAG: hypothetical protein KC493_06630 [Bacteriovoracaceae bacterium]|nr:hypothetical protein [Bacteriovoracaceae bacterium]
MIHGSSNDPVLIKRIPLRIWHLRDEIEAIVKDRLIARKHNGEEGDAPSVEDLIQEYKPKPKPTTDSETPDAAEGAPSLEVIEGGEPETEEGEASEGEEAANPEEDQEAADEAKEMVGGKSDDELKKDAVIIQRRPQLEEDKVIHATAILAEIDMDHMYIFSNNKFIPGQSIVLDFVVPKRFTINADVFYCREYNMRSRIISDKKLPYRIAVRYTFLKEGERTLLRNFIASIEPSIEAVKVVPKMQSAASDDDDDFDELDDFDL